MKRLGFLNLRGISGQIAALVVASIVASHLILTATFLIHRPDQLDPPIDRGNSQLAAAVQLLGATPATERPRLFADIARAFPQLDIESLPPGFAAAANEPDGLSLRSLHRMRQAPTRSASRCRTARWFPQSSCGTSGNVRSGLGRGS
jgi:hypothetical protein